MADQAQRAEILEVTFAAAFRDGHDMVGIPKRPAREPFEAPVCEQLLPVTPSGPLQFEVCGTGIAVADGANAAFSLEDLLAEIAWVGAKTPFVDAPVRAEGEAPRRHFEVAPAAERTTVRPFL